MGQRLRELRVERGFAQGDVAERLGISPAYLSLLEKGKRAVPMAILVKALELYGVGMEQFVASLGEGRVDDALAGLLDDPLLRSLRLGDPDLRLLGAEPKFVTTITALYNLYKNTRSQLDQVLAHQTADGGSLRFDYGPFDEVTDFLEQHRNYFPDLEARAEQLRAEARLDKRVRSDELVAVLRQALGVDVRLVPYSDGSVIWRWDDGARRLEIAESLAPPRLCFQLAHAIALRLFESEGLHTALVAGGTATHPETPRLLKLHLANYFAGALLLPYGPFYADVRRTRYDVELLTQIYQTSYETVAHRICNLADPKLPGVPMHFVRVDVAGNISKRYASDGMRFPQAGGSCPRMAVHLAFLTPSVITKQYSVFPDGATYFCFAKVVASPEQGSLARGTTYSVGLGCRAEDAKHLVYADDVPALDARRVAIPVGTTCRFCERTDCNMRAAPSYKFAFRVDEHVKKDNFFSPATTGEPPSGTGAGRRTPRS